MNYNESARLGLERYQKDRDALLLAIESSCDETAAAVSENGTKILSSVISTQIEEHRKYGGVVPEIASRRHCENLSLIHI